eukprot:3299536-Prymnesium_polylepis.2
MCRTLKRLLDTTGEPLYLRDRFPCVRDVRAFACTNHYANSSTVCCTPGWILLIDEGAEQARAIVALLVSIGFFGLNLRIRPQRRCAAVGTSNRIMGVKTANNPGWMCSQGCVLHTCHTHLQA